MYAGPQVNHEEYLLGRKIDKNVEILKEEDDKPVGASNVKNEDFSGYVKSFIIVHLYIYPNLQNN